MTAVAEQMCHAWLSPEGELHPVQKAEHYDFAAQMARRMFDGETVIDPVGLLEFLGWVHLSFDEVYLTRKPTRAQEDALARIAVEYRWMRSWDELSSPMYADGRFGARRYHLRHDSRDRFYKDEAPRYDPENIFPASQREAMRSQVGA